MCWLCMQNELLMTTARDDHVPRCSVCLHEYKVEHVSNYWHMFGRFAYFIFREFSRPCCRNERRRTQNACQQTMLLCTLVSWVCCHTMLITLILVPSETSHKQHVLLQCLCVVLSDLLLTWLVVEVYLFHSSPLPQIKKLQNPNQLFPGLFIPPPLFFFFFRFPQRSLLIIYF